MGQDVSSSNKNPTKVDDSPPDDGSDTVDEDSKSENKPTKASDTGTKSTQEDSKKETESVNIEDESYAVQEHFKEFSETLEDDIVEASARGEALDKFVEDNTVSVHQDLDEDDFFTTTDGYNTLVDRYDLEKAVSNDKKTHFVEEQRYWVNKPFVFIIIFHSTKENEKKYFAIEPYLNKEEQKINEFIEAKLPEKIKYSKEAGGDKTNPQRARVLEKDYFNLLFRYDLIDHIPFDREYRDEQEASMKSTLDNLVEKVSDLLNGDGKNESGGFLSLFTGEKEAETLIDKIGVQEQITQQSGMDLEHIFTPPEDMPELDKRARPEVAVLNDKNVKLKDEQMLKILYYVKRNSVGYSVIDPIKHDINVEDISCDGYNSRVFVYHSDYEQIISNIWHGKEDLDNFIISLAQRSGKGISKREPQVDTTLPDGSRAQLTLGSEVSDHGTNYTIRQFKDVPFTPIDLINWKTFGLGQMAFLWLSIENHKSLIFAGGTASGKTTSLNAVSLFIPSNSKIVSIEDTREVELPQRNWVASVTRPSFTDEGGGEVDEFDLLEAALRQRPDYIVMGEIRGEEGRTLFQVMSTGHTTYTTFHADSVGEVLKRFTTEPINVSKTLFTALDLVSIQTQTRKDGRKVRRSKTITEINDYNAENDEINVKDVYEWNARDDTFNKTKNPGVLDTIKFDRGWDQTELDRQIHIREVVIAYLIVNRLNTYREVAATIQAFINDPNLVLSLVANDELESNLQDLREMESVVIDIDPEKEAMVPRPEPPEEVLEEAKMILEKSHQSGELRRFVGNEADGSIGDALHESQKENAPTPDDENDDDGGMSGFLLDDENDPLLELDDSEQEENEPDVNSAFAGEEDQDIKEIGTDRTQINDFKTDVDVGEGDDTTTQQPVEENNPEPSTEIEEITEDDRGDQWALENGEGTEDNAEENEFVYQNDDEIDDPDEDNVGIDNPDEDDDSDDGVEYDGW